MITGFPSLQAVVDKVFLIIVSISVFLLVLITFVMIYFVIRYSRKRNPVATDIEGNLFLEIAWTIVPTIIVLTMFWYGYVGFEYMRTVPKNAMTVHVTARKWSWLFTYENGKKEDELRVPLGKPVKLLISSEDVLHSLYIPAYRIKEDAVPGQETHLWFKPDARGIYDLFCAEYCGMGHSAMITKVVVMGEKEFNAWYTGKGKEEEEVSTGKGEKHEVSKGAKLVKTGGCLGCHSSDGSKRVGPTFKGLYMKKITVITGGQERNVTADEAYYLRSILAPKADVVKGFPPIMPSQEGKFSEEELKDIIEYLKTLK